MNEDKNIEIIKHFDTHTKPYCVLGVLLSENGIKIKKEMLSWLTPVYDVISVEQNMPGDLFEYPAINYVVELAKTTNEICLYVHTKGAAFTRNSTGAVRNMWKDEFINHRKEYIKLFDKYKNEPVVFCPMTGPDKNTWFNGFYITPEAAQKTQKLMYNSSRFYWESMYRRNDNVKVIGRLINDVKDIKDKDNINKLLNYIRRYKQVNVCIVHYNTPLLTECLVKSINKFTLNSNIYIFDNSDKLPFTYRQDNLIYLDNTKGQIINFDEWLKKFPNRTKSNGKINLWGSAKHAYTIQKCIDLIPDGFILLDSDVLLKKDIAELVDESCAYVAETELQGNSNITRVIPFVCYINSKFLKEHKITYFNPNYMHGLYVTGTGDMYDTGSWFYKSAEKFKHNTIICNDYVVHFKGASWNTTHENRYGKNITAQDWLNIHKKLYMNDEDCKNSKVIYTCITNKYDGLYEVQSYFPGYDFICYTDNPHLKSRTWEIRYIPEHIKNLTPVKQQRYIKTHPHELFPDYEISIWVDGNVDVLQDPTPLINDNYIEIPKHPKRNCIYVEGKECISQRKDTATHINEQLNRYKKEGYPKNNGLPQSNIIIRKHNDENCIKLMNDWWTEIERGSHRDQLSFNYVLWKNPDIKVFYLDKNISNSKYFHWNVKHGLLSPLKRTTSTVKTNLTRRIVTKSTRQIERPNKVHIESSWNPITVSPPKTAAQVTVPKLEPPKNNKNKTVHIKRLFY